MGSYECSEAAGGGAQHEGATDLAVSLLRDGVGDLDARALAGRLADVERAMRKLEAVAVTIVAEADRREAFREDGHVSVRGWVKASIRASDTDVLHRVRCAKLSVALPRCGAELAAGRLGVAQVRELARVHANGRCADQLGEAVEGMIGVATAYPFEIFRDAARQWERVADADGAHDHHEHAHAGRSARASTIGETTYLDARFGTAQGVAITEVLDRFTQAEFDSEWDELRARFGDDACPGQLERSDAQRRADALVAIFLAAASAAPGAQRPVPIVNIVVDQAVYEAQLAAMIGDDAVAPPALRDAGRLRCRTVGGIPMDPADAVAASLVGLVRRVVVDGDGVIIDLGRRSRVFTGSAREAALLQAALDGDGRCLWPGCRRSRCQIDHCEAWAAGGSTDLRNAGPLCPRHNRFKARGYRTWRDASGCWHTQRPDGTEIVAA